MHFVEWRRAAQLRARTEINGSRRIVDNDDGRRLRRVVLELCTSVGPARSSGARSSGARSSGARSSGTVRPSRVAPRPFVTDTRTVDLRGASASGEANQREQTSVLQPKAHSLRLEQTTRQIRASKTRGNCGASVPTLSHSPNWNTPFRSLCLAKTGVSPRPSHRSTSGAPRVIQLG